MQPYAAGRLLVATPVLTDPNFDRTVLFMCSHDADGAFGVVLNRPVEARAADLVPEWSALLTPPGALHAGGPVERASFLGLGRWTGLDGPAPEWWTPVRHGVGLVNLSADAAQARGLEALRVFHGYAGWGPGQLDAEIGEDAWFIVDAEADDPFTDRPDRLWNQVLGRQRGPLAMYGHYPADHRLN